jgi:hypothetical protein
MEQAALSLSPVLSRYPITNKKAFVQSPSPLDLSYLVHSNQNLTR